MKGGGPVAIECKRKSSDFDPKPLLVFRRLHPAGRNFVVATDVRRLFEHPDGDVLLRFVDLSTLITELIQERPLATRRGARLPGRSGRKADG